MSEHQWAVAEDIAEELASRARRAADSDPNNRFARRGIESMAKLSMHTVDCLRCGDYDTPAEFLAQVDALFPPAESSVDTVVESMAKHADQWRDIANHATSSRRSCRGFNCASNRGGK